MNGSPVNRLERHWARSEQVAAGVPEPYAPTSRVKSWERKVETIMGRHPAIALLAAAGLGLLLGWMVKRK